jgi:hypothetical protein
LLIYWVKEHTISQEITLRKKHQRNLNLIKNLYPAQFTGKYRENNQNIGMKLANVESVGKFSDPLVFFQ